MMSRREVLSLLTTVSAGTWLLGNLATSDAKEHAVLTPQRAPGSPKSPERTALIDAFRKESEGLDTKYEAHSYKSDWTMPYRLFRPEANGKLPLILYLHGSGGLGDDNHKQLEYGNIFATRAWLLPRIQKEFPCYVLAPQTDRGWVHYDLSKQGDGMPPVLPGLGDGSRLAIEIVESLKRQFDINERRLYVMGQSMGGSGVWNVLKHRPNYFSAAVVCCGAEADDDGTGSLDTPVWNFHGDADQNVPVSMSRNRIAARRKAGGHPLYTEYAGVEHNVWQWAFTEPELAKWLFAQKL